MFAAVHWASWNGTEVTPVTIMNTCSGNFTCPGDAVGILWKNRPVLWREQSAAAPLRTPNLQWEPNSWVWDPLSTRCWGEWLTLPECGR
jgi:hypothetical protein